MRNSHRRYREIGARISRYIAEMGLRPGSRLPGEISLSKICGVSRPTVREALIGLEIAGELEIRTGAGAYVCEPRIASLLLDSVPGPFEILRALILIEGGTAAAAAVFASALDLAKIEQILRQMRQVVTANGSSLELVRQFHVSIAAASKNSPLKSIVEGLWSEMFAPRYSQLSCQASLHNHPSAIFACESVFEAIAGRNPREARLAMKRNLQYLENCLLRGEEYSVIPLAHRSIANAPTARAGMQV